MREWTDTVLESAELLSFVPVRNVGRARAFYESVLGCTVSESDDYGCMLEWRGARLRLARVGDDAPSYTVLGWVVPSIEDAVRSLVGAGVEFRSFEGMGQDALGIWAAPSGDQVAWFGATEGNTLSLTQEA
jgi:catechol 2,3-dioxygenase-like lactoylglutathione lyase family enzyme